MKIIVGGGISGLWLAAELHSRNIPCLILEKAAVGEAQTLASQGMIHGGTKYSLEGILTKAASEVSMMPGRWREALKGQGTVDLSGVEVERDNQLLWSVGSIQNNLIGFFASKAMKSRMERIKPSEEEAFSSPNFKGQLYKLFEPVIKIDTLIGRFTELLPECIFQAEVSAVIYEMNQVVGVKTNLGDVRGEVILTAGEGIEQILINSNIEYPKMQRRPLAMGVARLEAPIPKVFGHQLGRGARPKLTISTHELNGYQYLYVGGQVAEDGTNRDDLSQIEALTNALKLGLPWLSLKISELFVYRVNRAEPDTGLRIRPDSAYVSTISGMHVCWPTKLALAPALANKVIPRLKLLDRGKFPNFPNARQGSYPWL